MPVDVVVTLTRPVMPIPVLPLPSKITFPVAELKVIAAPAAPVFWIEMPVGPTPVSVRLPLFVLTDTGEVEGRPDAEKKTPAPEEVDPVKLTVPVPDEEIVMGELAPAPENVIALPILPVLPIKAIFPSTVEKEVLLATLIPKPPLAVPVKVNDPAPAPVPFEVKDALLFMTILVPPEKVVRVPVNFMFP